METNKENKKKLVLKKIFLLKAIMMIGIIRIIELITLSNGEKKFINSAKNERIIIEYMSDLRNPQNYMIYLGLIYYIGDLWV